MLGAIHPVMAASMRPGQAAPDELDAYTDQLAAERASMRPGQAAPDEFTSVFRGVGNVIRLQ